MFECYVVSNIIIIILYICVYRRFVCSDTVGANVLGAVTRIIIVVALAAFVFSTVPTWYEKQKTAFDVVEWTVSILFSIEYLLRFYSSVEDPFYGRLGPSYLNDSFLFVCSIFHLIF